MPSTTSHIPVQPGVTKQSHGKVNCKSGEAAQVTQSGQMSSLTGIPSFENNFFRYEFNI